MKFSDQTKNFAITGENMNEFYRFKRGLCEVAKIAAKVPEKIDRTLKYWRSDRMNTSLSLQEEQNALKKVGDKSVKTTEGWIPSNRISSKIKS